MINNISYVWYPDISQFHSLTVRKKFAHADFGIKFESYGSTAKAQDALVGAATAEYFKVTRKYHQLVTE